VEAFTKEDHHAVGIVADQLGAALRNAFLVEELRRADELKNQMLSIVSHEFSTPLTAIKEGINLILDGALGDTTPDQRDFLGTVNENAERLGRIIQKVRTATELMTGQTRFTFESFDLRTLLGNLEKTYRAPAKTKGVSVKFMEYPKPLFWHLDRVHATMALGQVLENAIQATPPDGLVTLKLSATPAEVEIQIVDTGRGIAKEEFPTLFDRFQSIGGIHDRKMGGLGLGLFIAKSLIEGHGGTLTVESTLGQGTWMTIRLPKQPPATAES
jgi:signal transduction histidine kinase